MSLVLEDGCVPYFGMCSSSLKLNLCMGCRWFVCPTYLVRTAPSSVQSPSDLHGHTPLQRGSANGGQAHGEGHVCIDIQPLGARCSPVWRWSYSWGILVFLFSRWAFFLRGSSSVVLPNPRHACTEAHGVGTPQPGGPCAQCEKGARLVSRPWANCVPAS